MWRMLAARCLLPAQAAAMPVWADVVSELKGRGAIYIEVSHACAPLIAQGLQYAESGSLVRAAETNRMLVSRGGARASRPAHLAARRGVSCLRGRPGAAVIRRLSQPLKPSLPLVHCMQQH